MPVVSILISVGHNKKLLAYQFFCVFFLKVPYSPHPPPPLYGVLHLYNHHRLSNPRHINQSNLLGLTEGWIGVGWVLGGGGWCSAVGIVCWCSLQRRLCVCLRESCSQVDVHVAFSSREEGKKIAPTETSASIPPPSHAFSPNHPRTENTFKKPRATQTNTPKIVERNTHTKIYWKIKYWLLIELHLILIMPSLLVMIVLIYVPERQVDHVEIQRTYNVQWNSECKHWRTKRYSNLWYSIHRFGVYCSPPPPAPTSLIFAKSVQGRCSSIINDDIEKV